MKKITLITAAIVLLSACNNSQKTKEDMSTAEASNKDLPTLTHDWDKIFPQSDKVEHQKVQFTNRYGITLVGDLYIPKDKKGEKLPAIAISGPFGAVKEQVSGLYAQTLAEKGFVTLAFDPSYTGESGGEPRNMASPDINTEDFSAAVDFLGVYSGVNREKIGILGICGFGGQAINTAAMDTRIKAVATSVLYDMSRSMGWGVGDQKDGYTTEQRQKVKEYLNQLRWKEAENKTRGVGLHELPINEKGEVFTGELILPNALPENPHPVLKEFFEYYKERGYHKRGINSNTAWLGTMPLSFINIPMMSYANEISAPALVIAGENAHSKYMSEEAFKKIGSKDKELYIVPNATHTDLYDNKAGKIPYDKLEQFFKENLK